MTPEIQQLLRTLNQVVGPKMYLRDLEQFLRNPVPNTEIPPQVRQALRYLNQDLQSLGQAANQKKRFF